MYVCMCVYIYIYNSRSDTAPAPFPRRSRTAPVLLPDHSHITPVHTYHTTTFRTPIFTNADTNTNTRKYKYLHLVTAKNNTLRTLLLTHHTLSVLFLSTHPAPLHCIAPYHLPHTKDSKYTVYTQFS